MVESSMRMTSQDSKRDADEIRIINAAQRDPRAFGDLYLQYVERVFRYTFTRIGDVKAAEDATAQTFLAALESLDRYREDGHFASWLFGIARNKAMDYFRWHSRLIPMEAAGEIPVEETTLAQVIQSEQAKALSKIIQALPEEERELLRLRFMAELTYPEIARLLHRNEEAVKKTIYRLLARLHSQMEDKNE